MARAIDVHASLGQDRLTERELLARVASRSVSPRASVVTAHMLAAACGSSIYAFRPISWSRLIARSSRAELSCRTRVLKAPVSPTRRSGIFDDQTSTSRRSTSRSTC